MSILDYIKEFLGINDNNKDSLLNIYIRKATEVVLMEMNCLIVL